MLHRQLLQAFGLLLAATVIGKLTLHHAAHPHAPHSHHDTRVMRDKATAYLSRHSPLQSDTETFDRHDAELRQMWEVISGVNEALRGAGAERDEQLVASHRVSVGDEKRRQVIVSTDRAAPIAAFSPSQSGVKEMGNVERQEEVVPRVVIVREDPGAVSSSDTPSFDIRNEKRNARLAAPKVVLAGEVEYVWVFHNADGGYKYNHMATSEVLPDGRLVVAWQRAHAAEGLNDQELVWSVSGDGGRSWSEAEVVPGRESGIMWTPSLFRPPGGALHLFYTESHGCWWCESVACFRAHCRAGATNCHVTVPFGSTKLNLAKLSRDAHRRRLSSADKEAKVAGKPGGGVGSITWRAGGDLKVVTADVTAEGLKWGTPRVILSEEAAGPVPKVIANPPIVEPRSGRWVLPYWRETPRGEVVCPTKAPGGDFASILLSDDQGATWRSGPEIKMPNPWSNLTKPDWLIEGSVAPSRDGSALLQAFRTSREKAYFARSLDAGDTWLPAEPSPLPNPNAKMNILRLSNGALAAAYNAHGSEQYKRRSLLTVAVSGDDGSSWTTLATVESRLVQELRFHYPMLRQMGCRLLLTYSVMMPPKSQERGGIRLVQLPVCFGAAHAECACDDSAAKT